MRIAVMGTAGQGKSTFIKDFLKNWKGIYTSPEKTYRDIIEEKGLPHSKDTSKETQRAILDFMAGQTMEYSKDDRIIYDRCPLDNIVYSIYALDKQIGDIDEDFIGECIPLVRESTKFLDLIFHIPQDPTIKVEDDNMRETDMQYITEINELFTEIEKQSLSDHSVFFTKDDKPPIITITGKRSERIRQSSLYISDDGGMNSGEEDEEGKIDWEGLAEMGYKPTDFFPDGQL
jgi:predicted ATPase